MCVVLTSMGQSARQQSLCSKSMDSSTKPLIGIHNVQRQPFVRSANVLLPPLHIKLGLMKNFVKAMNRNGHGFIFLKDFFGADKSDAKLKAGVFVGLKLGN